jgi:hypothetical protein
VTTPKSKYPVSSFGPELMAFLLKAGRQRTMLLFDSKQIPDPDDPRKQVWDGAGKRLAHNFHRRIHTLRSKMREEKHEQFPFAARAKISIYWGPYAVAQGGPKEWLHDHKGDRGAIIVGRPQDADFTEILQQAGIETGPSPPSPAAPSTSEPEQPIMTDEAAPNVDWLDEIWPEGKEK